MSSKRWSKENISSAIKNNTSIASTLRDIGLTPSGGNYRQFHKYVRIYDLDLDHFTGQAHLKGKTHNWGTKIPLVEILVENSTYTNGTNLRKRILKADLLDYECAWCNLTEWRGKPLTLHLDHINGINNDNRIENLRFLCPNCHGQTETWGNKNSDLSSKPSNTCDECGTEDLHWESKRCASCHKTKNRNKSYSEIPNCVDCNTPISITATRCRSCEGKHRNNTKIDWPPCADLVQMIQDTNYSATGRKLGVSCNAVRKHLRNHYEGDLP